MPFTLSEGTLSLIRAKHAHEIIDHLSIAQEAASGLGGKMPDYWQLRVIAGQPVFEFGAGLSWPGKSSEIGFRMNFPVGAWCINDTPATRTLKFHLIDGMLWTEAEKPSGLEGFAPEDSVK